MANYKGFKRIDAIAVIDGQLLTNEIADGTIPTAAIADGGVDTLNFADGAVSAAKLDNTVDLSTKNITYRSFLAGDISPSAGIAGSKLASGAISTNLGSTPLNKAGGTMTGQLRTAAGSAAAPSIYYSAQTNTGINFNGTSTELVVAGTPGLTVNQGGQITRPNTPMFHAAGTSGWLYANSYGGTGWRGLDANFGWAAQQKGGSNFNTGDGRFTAPVKGFYQFMFETYCRNDANNTSGYIHMSIGINGGQAMVGGRTPHGMFGHSTGQNFYPHGVRIDLQTYMNAGQYAQVWVFWANNQTRFHGAHSFFNGYLVA